MVEPEKPKMTIGSMRIARWITKATDTHSECLLFIALLLQQRMREFA
jgi:hypothetical protein